MKKGYLVFPIGILLVVFLLGGCAEKSPSPGQGEDWPLSAEPEYVTEWPENAFTACITEPESGSIDYVCDYTENGRYQVVMKDITQNESADYVEQLLKQGYTELSSESNAASTGTILQKGDVLLSIAYSDNVLGILITMDKSA